MIRQIVHTLTYFDCTGELNVKELLDILEGNGLIVSCLGDLLTRNAKS